MGSFHLWQEKREQGNLGRLSQAVQWAGLGWEMATPGGQKNIIFDCFCPQDSQLGCRGGNWQEAEAWPSTDKGKAEASTLCFKGVS